MKTLALPLQDSDMDTRRKRRAVSKFIANELYRISMAEWAYRDRIPENMANGCKCRYAHKAAEDLFDAFLQVAEAFEPF